MNFLNEDDFGLGSSPAFNKKGSIAASQKGYGGDHLSQVSRKSGKSAAKESMLDALEGEMFSREDKRSPKKKDKDSFAPYSSSFLDLPPPPRDINRDMKRTQKWTSGAMDYDHQPPQFPTRRPNSIFDDDDKHSYVSGRTGRTGRQTQNNLDNDNIITLRPVEPQQPFFGERSSSRNMMKPPLRKRQQAKQPSIFGDEPPTPGVSRRNPGSTTNLDLASNIQIRDRSRNASPSDSPNNKEDKVREKIIEKEKIVTVREEATQLRKQFENEVKEIKQSYERQLRAVEEKLKNEIEHNQKSKAQLVKEHETRVLQQQKRWQQLTEQNSTRLKQMHEWELKRRSEAHQMEVEKLRSINKLNEQFVAKNKLGHQSRNDGFELKAKERELQAERQKLELSQAEFEQKVRNFESQERQFESRRRREEEQLQHEKRILLERQSQVKRQELENKRSLGLQKQKMASQVSAMELEVMRKKQGVNLEREELNMERELFERQKNEFEGFIGSLKAEYREKLREVQTQKQRINDLEIEMHKKIHVVQMASGRTTSQRGPWTQSESYQENQRSRVNTQHHGGKLTETKERFRQMSNKAKELSAETEHERLRAKGKVDVSGYIARMNRSISSRQ